MCRMLSGRPGKCGKGDEKSRDQEGGRGQICEKKKKRRKEAQKIINEAYAVAFGRSSHSVFSAQQPPRISHHSANKH